MRPVIKAVALENVLIALFLYDFLHCGNLGILVQDTAQGFIFISESWDLGVGKKRCVLHPTQDAQIAVWCCLEAFQGL